jgi:hypothetical protein
MILKLYPQVVLTVRAQMAGGEIERLATTPKLATTRAVSVLERMHEAKIFVL